MYQAVAQQIIAMGLAEHPAVLLQTIAMGLANHQAESSRIIVMEVAAHQPEPTQTYVMELIIHRAAPTPASTIWPPSCRCCHRVSVKPYPPCQHRCCKLWKSFGSGRADLSKPSMTANTPLWLQTGPSAGIPIRLTARLVRIAPGCWKP